MNEELKEINNKISDIVTMELYEKVRGIVFRDIRDKLLKGEEVYIDGVGYLKLKYRNVCNNFGRDYSIKVILDQDRKFKESLSVAYENGKLDI